MINYKDIAVKAGVFAGSYVIGCAIGYAAGKGIELWMFNKATKIKSVYE
jgi:hypothetical protein